MGTLGDVPTTKRKPREKPAPAPARPTVADVDSWLAQIDDVLAEAPGAQRGTSR